MEFHLKDMECGGCARSVAKAVEQVDPAAKIVTDLASRTVRIESSEPAARFEQALGAAGFPTAPVA